MFGTQRTLWQIMNTENKGSYLKWLCAILINENRENVGNVWCQSIKIENMKAIGDVLPATIRQDTRASRTWNSFTILLNRHFFIAGITLLQFQCIHLHPKDLNINCFSFGKNFTSLAWTDWPRRSWGTHKLYFLKEKVEKTFVCFKFWIILP